MGGIQSNKKYVLLYGPEGSGKSALLYSQNSTIRLFEPIEPTKGINYEELKIFNHRIGVFEVSGNLQQSNLLDIVTHSVLIQGIIFVVNINEIENIDFAKMQLKIVLSNTNLPEDIVHLFIVYNLRSSERERYSWMNTSALDDGLGVKKLKNTYHLKSVSSCIYDCSTNNYEVKDEQSLNYKMKDFIVNLSK